MQIDWYNYSFINPSREHWRPYQAHLQMIWTEDEDHLSYRMNLTSLFIHFDRCDEVKNWKGNVHVVSPRNVILEPIFHLKYQFEIYRRLTLYLKVKKKRIKTIYLNTDMIKEAKVCMVVKRHDVMKWGSIAIKK